MFGVIVSGRPVYTESQPVTPTSVAFALPAAPAFSHIVVFLLPGAALPPETGAAVYIQLPGSTDFRLLGAIANEKQSAIFKINNTGASLNAGPDDAMTDEGAPSTGAGGSITLGISVEPAAQIATALASLKAPAQPTTGQELARPQAQFGAAVSPVTTKILAQRIIRNAFNFLASFGSETVPLKAFQEWWKKFEAKVERDPGFLERDE
ncbi:hypothetical protein W97_00193 [Coniosporium apollinis CBS 100218]|uniref:Uncharacterized protein n=1 Tax=Coniosporium apollinis (strain CBS 100218) TaxID=1168221 RepID=R7YGG9_CONA1|nr:uncharacterized protein W97_00193 [Coniosporium apollinis CBS 100218]EON60983.1 hypothetical protein W97_00193 [Coniosporium apollinis CBS 100218]